MKFAVVGAGEIGTACALALTAGGARDVALLSRDQECADKLHSRTFKVFPRTPLTVPPALRLQELLSAPVNAHDVVFVCTPCPSLVPLDETTVSETSGQPHGDAVVLPPQESVVQYLQRWAYQRKETITTSAAVPSDISFAAVFTRGLSECGMTAVDLVDSLVNCRQHSTAAPLQDDSEVLTNNKALIPVLAVCGPVLACEWASQSSPKRASQDSGVPPRPRSACTEGDDDDLAAAATAAGMSACRSSIGASSHNRKDLGSLRQCFSGTALTFALATPELRSDHGLQRALASRLMETFPRESVTFLEAEESADVLALVNGCIPLCSFGAGMVSNVYAGASVSALAAYSQHALAATETLVNAVLGRPQGTPLPHGACIALSLGCSSFASREFVLGRQLDFHFRKQDVIRAVFPGASHTIFSATVDGMHTLLQKHHVSSPFYEVLMDSFNTLIRASTAGEGLVKEGFYNYREGPPSLLLQHAVKVDEAMLSGDEEQFEDAKRRLVEAFTTHETGGGRGRGGDCIV